MAEAALPPAPAFPPLDNSIGAFLVGTILTVFLAGITSVQSYSYFTWFGRTDRKLLVGVVAFLMAVDLFHTAISCYTIYLWTVTHYGDIAFLINCPWSFTWDPFLTGLVAIIVQAFYAWRVFVVSHRNWYIPAAIGVLSLLQFAFAIGSTWMIYRLDDKLRRVPLRRRDLAPLGGRRRHPHHGLAYHVPPQSDQGRLPDLVAHRRAHHPHHDRDERAHVHLCHHRRDPLCRHAAGLVARPPEPVARQALLQRSPRLAQLAQGPPDAVRARRRQQQRHAGRHARAALHGDVRLGPEPAPRRAAPACDAVDLAGACGGGQGRGRRGEGGRALAAAAVPRPGVRRPRRLRRHRHRPRRRGRSPDARRGAPRHGQEPRGGDQQRCRPLGLVDIARHATRRPPSWFNSLAFSLPPSRPSSFLSRSPGYRHTSSPSPPA